MFQNPTIAKAHGARVEAELLAKGALPSTARLQGKMAAVKEEKRLDKWVKENVGLN